MSRHHHTTLQEDQSVFVTIDGESTRDLDDAFSIEQTVDGYRLQVAIADPTDAVMIGSPEDIRARELGSSIYARHRTVKRMLPTRIAEQECSLVAGEWRLAMVFDIGLSTEFVPLSFEPRVGRIKVCNRLSYEDIPAILSNAEHPLHGFIHLASKVGRMLMEERRNKGAVALYDLSRFLVSDEEGNLVELGSHAETIGHIIVQETMILTNAMLGEFMVAHNLPGLFRNHEAKVTAPVASEVAKSIEAWMHSDDATSEQLAHFDGLTSHARYGAVASGHFGLNLPMYLHATSPLRRYADLVNLRQVKAYLRGEAAPYTQADLAIIAEDMNAAIDRQKDERKHGFKDGHPRGAVRTVETGSPGRLADHAISAAVKHAGQLGCMPEALLKELVYRFNNGTLADALADRLTFETPPQAFPPALASAMAAWLQAKPGRASQLLAHGHQAGFLTPPLTVSASRHAGFSVEMRVTLQEGGREYLGVGYGQRVHQAEQQAAIDVIAQIRGLSVRQAGLPAQERPIATSVSANPTAALLALCRKHKWPRPAFSTAGAGQSRQFGCVVKLTVGGVRHEVHAKGAASKQDAEARAAAMLLANLPLEARAESGGLHHHRRQGPKHRQRQYRY